jgi:hypothetical protein
MTYWINTPVTLAADRTIHAGITRYWLQDNLRTVMEQSGYNHDVTIRDLPTTAITTVDDDTWAWVTGLTPFPIPIWHAQGGGWRTYTFDVLSKSQSTDITLRVHLLKQKTSPPIDSVTGDVIVDGGVTSAYADLTITAAAWARHDGTITIGDADQASVGPVTLDQVWVHLAAWVTGAPGGDDELYLHAFHIAEGA